MDEDLINLLASRGLFDEKQRLALEQMKAAAALREPTPNGRTLPGGIFTSSPLSTLASGVSGLMSDQAGRRASAAAQGNIDQATAANAALLRAGQAGIQALPSTSAISTGSPEEASASEASYAKALRGLQGLGLGARVADPQGAGLALGQVGQQAGDQLFKAQEGREGRLSREAIAAEQAAARQAAAEQSAQARLGAARIVAGTPGWKPSGTPGTAIETKTGETKPIPLPVGPGGPPTTGSGMPKTRVLTAGELKALQDENAAVANIKRLSDSFQDEYAGRGVLGNAPVAIAQQLGSSGSTKQQKLATWWQDYRDTVENIKRKTLAGVAVTPTEKRLFDISQTIKPGTAPAVVREKFNKVMAEARQRLEGHIESREAAGYQPEALAPLAPEAGPTERRAVRTGKTKDGRKVVQYSDGTIEEEPSAQP